MMIRKREPRVPEGVDVTRPSIARIYDYLRGVAKTHIDPGAVARRLRIETTYSL